MSASSPIPQTPPPDKLLALLGPIHDDMRALARRIARSFSDGDDLFQEAAIRALSRLDELRDDKKFRAWFTRILLSVHRNRYRQSFWKRVVPIGREQEPATLPATPDPGSAGRAQRALATLPPVQREAIVLFELEGLTVDEIAVLQSVSASAVKSRLARGRRRLRAFYRRLGVMPAADMGSVQAQGAAAVCKGDLS